MLTAFAHPQQQQSYCTYHAGTSDDRGDEERANEKCYVLAEFAGVKGGRGEG